VAALVLADAHALRIVAVGAEGRRAAGADPLRAALVAALLLLKPFAKGLKQFLKTADGFDLALFLFGQIFFREFPQPFARNLDGDFA
jgi:hypothetical protein